MAVVVKSLTKLYGSQKATDNISFTARKGEILGFLGPNGAGKTTTMKMLTSYILPSSGQATVCGHDVVMNSIESRQCIGYLPEHNALYKDMYVKEYLSFIAGIYKVRNARARVDEMIEMTGLSVEAHKHIGALSKGYKQRVGLAQAMIHDPEVLILDEPTSGLDPNQLIEIRQLIQKMGREKTVIFSTHIMQEVQAICDRVVIINQGELVADSSIDDLKQVVSGQDELYIQCLEPINQTRLREIQGVNFVEKKGRGVVIGYDRVKDIRPEVFRALVENQNTILEMRKLESSIEDIFQQLTANNG